MYKGRTVSVVIPAYNEEDAIESTIRDFQRSFVDEIVVVDNNSRDRTAELARSLGARVVHEARQGYGYAVRRALQEAKGDYVVLTEADTTFRGADLTRLLKHAPRHHMVIGTRTTTPLLDPKANMGLFLVAGNIFIAKILAILYNIPQLTDVGCTYRLIHKNAVQRILPYLSETGAALSPEMIIIIRKLNGKVKEIPVMYYERIGESKITVTKRKAFSNGLRMIWVILSRFLPPYRRYDTIN
ncbi:MAG: glycosyltransferase family 2 protein [Candidatus Ranarchaeia archaeon]